jgi:gliding motility-associated-like protein
VRFFPPCDPANIKIPNIFTPNGDNLNDGFLPVQPEGAEQLISMAIYARWGEKIFETFDSEPFWDGKSRGKDCPNDVYIWILEVLCNGEKTKISGEVNLVR